MSRAAGPTWQSAQHDLSKRGAAKVRANWGEFVQYTVPPGLSFDWGAWSLREDLKHYCLHHGWIQRADDGERWETNESLWMFLISNAADDETIGAEAAGQEQLPIEHTGSSAGDARIIGGATPRSKPRSRRSRETQSTLTGDGPDELVKGSDQIRVNAAKGTSRPSRSARARADECQATLTGREDAPVREPGRWDTDASEPVTGLTRRSGARVYAGQRPLIIG